MSIQQNNYTQVIPEGKEVKYEVPTEGDDLVVKVTKSKTFDAARKYTEGKTAVLNFASATTPGGGVTKAQLLRKNVFVVVRHFTQLCQTKDVGMSFTNHIATI